MFLTVFKTISFLSIILLCSLISHGNFERKAIEATISVATIVRLCCSSIILRQAVRITTFFKDSWQICLTVDYPRLILLFAGLIVDLWWCVWWILILLSITRSNTWCKSTGCMPISSLQQYVRCYAVWRTHGKHMVDKIMIISTGSNKLKRTEFESGP